MKETILSAITSIIIISIIIIKMDLFLKIIETCFIPFVICCILLGTIITVIAMVLYCKD